MERNNLIYADPVIRASRIFRAIISHKRYPLFLFISLLLFFSLSGCVNMYDPESSQDYGSEVIANISPGNTFGQTFISHRPRLSSIDLWLKVTDAQDKNGILAVELFHSPDDSLPWFTTQISFDNIRNNSPVRIAFSPPQDPPDQNYYLKLSTLDGTVEVLGRNGDAYPQGNASINGQPVVSDAAFRLSYDYNLQSLFDDLGSSLVHGWQVIPLVLTLLLPGWLLLGLAGNLQKFDFGEQVALSLTLSMAVVPVLMTWTTSLGIKWSQVGVRAAAGLIVLGAVTRWWLNGRRGTFSEDQSRSNSKPTKPGRWQWISRFDWTSLALLGVFVIALAVRLIMVRDLAASPWVDSVHHALITRLILDLGAFPNTYAPYLNIETARYHAGFHSILATFIWISGLDLRAAMLLFGQVLNTLSVFAVYAFTTSLVRSRRAGVIAALITAVITPMPAYYTSWGRYTQLAGVLILPGAFLIIKTLLDTRFDQETLKSPNIHWKLLLLAGIACAGLFLTHYRVIAFLALLLLVYLPFHLASSIQTKAFWKNFRHDSGWISGVVLGAILFALPWWPSTLSTLFLPKLAEWSGVKTTLFSDFSWGFLTTALGKYSIGLAGLGLVWGIRQRRGFSVIMLIWAALLFTLANLAAFNLPGGGFVNNTSVEIILFMPLSALGGYFLSRLLSGWSSFIQYRWLGVYYAGLGAIGLVIAFVGARQLIPILNPTTFLFRQADQPAMTWIEENVPAGETILINPFSWGYGLYAGNDGGFWISPLTRHVTIPPPVLYGLDDNPAHVQQINEIIQKVIELSQDPTELYTYLKSINIHYIYIGARGGILSPDALRASGLFEIRFQQNGVWVFYLGDVNP
jgi:hypothetical protein